MYIPPAFAETRPETLFRMIEGQEFALLVSHGVDGLTASHLPFLVEPESGPQGTLLGHLARANPHARAIDDGTIGEAMVIFQGPHGYVSPRWYEVHPAVPTWNYTAVHVYGRPRVIREPAALADIVDRLSRRYEGSAPDAWRMASLDEKFLAGMLKGIVGFAMPIERIEGKLKLSQNRKAVDRRQVIAALGGSARESDRDLAEAMQRFAPPPNE